MNDSLDLIYNVDLSVYVYTMALHARSIKCKTYIGRTREAFPKALLISQKGGGKHKYGINEQLKGKEEEKKKERDKTKTVKNRNTSIRFFFW